MGYTHHWKRGTEFSATAFAAAVQDCRKVLNHLDIPLAGFDGTGPPIFDSDAVVFNGGCEPFEIHQIEFDRRGRKEFFSFCKTEHAPYDISVQAALIVFKHHLGDAISVGSDGNDAAWNDARKACQDCLGYGAEFRLERGEL